MSKRFYGLRKDYQPDLRIKWTPKRIARLAMLVGQGYSAKQIAEDMGETPNNVYQQVKHHKISFFACRAQPLSAKARVTFNRAAAVRNVQPKYLVNKILNILSECPVLIDNVLDDGRKTPEETNIS